MIMTVTLNPSVDIAYHLTEGFSLDQVNRVNEFSKTAGGKGLNVARVLRQLDISTAATGFIGGSLGQFIRNEMENLEIEDCFTVIEQATRNCIAILHDGNQTEILESGPTVSDEEKLLFLEELQQCIRKVDYMTISGSLPKGLPDDFYNSILTIASKNKVPVLLDTKGVLLNHCLYHEHKPYLIKPNQSELAELLGKEAIEEAEIIETLKNTMFDGVSWIVVTLGKDGAIVKNRHHIYRVDIPKVEAINPVGSGDSVIAGFAAGLSKGFQGISLVTYGLTMGILNAVEEKTGCINPDHVNLIRHQINCKEIE